MDKRKERSGEEPYSGKRSREVREEKNGRRMGRLKRKKDVGKAGVRDEVEG